MVLSLSLLHEALKNCKALLYLFAPAWVFCVVGVVVAVICWLWNLIDVLKECCFIVVRDWRIAFLLWHALEDCVKDVFAGVLVQLRKGHFYKARGRQGLNTYSLVRLPYPG